MTRNTEDFGQGQIDHYTARVRQDALEEAQRELESASGERRVNPKDFTDPAEYQEAVESAQGNAPAAEPDSPKMTAALSKARSSASRANIRDILG